MIPSESTRGIPVERPKAGAREGSSQTDDAWSFGPAARLLGRLSPQAADDRSRAANTNGASTGPSRGTPDLPDLKPVVPRRLSFGKQAFAPLFQWEGVVEEVHEDWFRARLLPLGGGPTESARVEYAEFEHDDLADESDHEMVEKGAVFYWTVGKRRNSAGTYTKASLVRFRRLPPPTAYQVREASEEADALLKDLGAHRSI